MGLGCLVWLRGLRTSPEMCRNHSIYCQNRTSREVTPYIPRGLQGQHGIPEIVLSPTYYCYFRPSEELGGHSLRIQPNHRNRALAYIILTFSAFGALGGARRALYSDPTKYIRHFCKPTAPFLDTFVTSMRKRGFPNENT